MKDPTVRSGAVTGRYWRGMGAYLSLLQLASALVLLALLTGCGALAPPSELSIEDPFGLHGLGATFLFEPSAEVGQPQGVTGGASTGAYEFADAESDFGIFEFLVVQPKSLENEVRLATVVVHDPLAPATITVTSAEFTARYWQGASSYEEAASADRAEMILNVHDLAPLRRVACDAESCSYDAAGALLGTLILEGEALSNYYELGLNPPAPNYKSESVQISAAEQELAWKLLTYTVDASRGVARF